MTDAPALIEQLAREVARQLTVKHGGRLHWSQWEEQHRDDALEVPVTYHVVGCGERAANHWHGAEGCSARCVAVQRILRTAGAYLGCAPDTFRQPVPAGPAYQQEALL